MVAFITNESELYFERGGPAYRLMQRIGTIQGDGPSIARRIFWLIAVTWVPLLTFALIDGRAIGPTPHESMLLDFANYARLLLLALLIIAEVVIGPHLTGAGVRFIHSGFLRSEDLPRVVDIVERVRRRREALAAELVILCAAFSVPWYFSVENWYRSGAPTWQSLLLPSGNLSLAGMWYTFISLPLLQFFFLRWLWRIAIWSGFLYEISKLNLNLVASHPDRAGGLGFLGVAHRFFGILSFGIGAVLSADAGFRIYFEGATLQSFQLIFVAYLVLNELLFVGPLLVFMPLLFRKKLEGLRDYSDLANDYDRSFQAKWLKHDRLTEEALLGSADIQGQANLGYTFDRVHGMRAVPFGPELILEIGVTAALPMVPLLLMVIPVAQILKILAAAIF